MGYVVRKAQSADLQATAKLAAQLIRLHHEWDEQRFFIVQGLERGYERFLRSVVDDSETVLLVAESNGAIVGYAYGSMVDRDWSDLRDRCGNCMMYTSTIRCVGKELHRRW